MTDHVDTLQQQLVGAARRRRRQQLIAGAGLLATLAVTVGAFVLVERLVKPVRPDVAAALPSAPVQSACGEPSCSREDFVDALRAFNVESRPAIDGVSLSAWDTARTQRIDALERKALDAFDVGDYDEATRAIRQATAAADEAIAHAREEYARRLASAKQAFAADDSALAQQAIDRALLIDPESTDAQVLGERIAVLPAVVDALESARVAAIENRPEQELRQLRAAFALDPARSTLAERIAALEGADQAERYRAAVAAAEGALNQGQLDRAQQAIDRAQRIDRRQDLSFLQGRLDAARTERRLDQALARARAARDQDDWRTALQAYEQALGVDGTNAGAVEGAEDARTVVSALERLQVYLDDPLRIGSPRVTQAAQRLQAELLPHRGLSATLDQRLDELTNYLKLATKPVKITVISDGLTDISVRRVGQVGKHERATIELTPGRYEVEGRRPGYRSKLVALDVNFGIERMQVEVVCDEPAV